MTLRPRLLLSVVCGTWLAVVVLGVCAVEVWAAYERRDAVPEWCAGRSCDGGNPLSPVKQRADGRVIEGGAAGEGLGMLGPSTDPQDGGPSVQARAVSGVTIDRNLRAAAEIDPHGQRLSLVTGVVSGRHLRSLATSAAHLCGVPVKLLHALVARESSWNPEAVSVSGARGLTQIMPATARGISPTLDLSDPWQQLLAGGCYLRQQYERFGSWRLALHAYHGGPNRKRTAQVTRDYAQDILEGGE